MRKPLLILLLFLPCGLWAQVNLKAYQKELKAHRKQMNREFADPATTPLTAKDFAAFKQLNFFAPDTAFRFTATFVRTPNQPAFQMPTTTERRPVYEKYGEVHLVYQGQTHVLNVYQSHDLRKKPGYLDYLFLPFLDATNGSQTYGGGRYLELRIPKGTTIVVDFNKAYNPYCAYNHSYSCPVVPKENTLPFAVQAGVKAYQAPAQ